MSEAGVSDSALRDLLFVIAAWDQLSDRVRQAVLTLIELDVPADDEPTSDP